MIIVDVDVLAVYLCLFKTTVQQAVWEKDEKEVGVGETGGRWIGRNTGKRNKKYVRRTHSFFPCT